ncbi:hypothetical protein Dsin_033049 [Dipteronia sinensis]|uniref:Small auxin up regulated protein n=1 Tax=Dipteronia sinensis TaxID=43782 RepID=A0AAD9ZIX2_9ROSI|nr:hypothetical protein Dsin_033049 [Dipteronia sinensis]
MSESNKICHIVRIRQMLRQWWRKTRVSASSRGTAGMPSDVPAGHVVVCVGAGSKWFLVRATHLNHPIFKRLLSQVSQVEEEYGFANMGPLTIPCDESTFEDILRVVSSESDRLFALNDFQRCCHVGVLTEPRLLLRGFANKSVC